MDYKSETQKTYDSYPEKFDAYFEQSFRNYMLGLADTFVALLKGKKILDLGSGPGNIAAYFREKGLDVRCADISPEMIRLCREKGLRAEVADMETMAFPPREFDGIWANAALLHLSKARVPAVLEKIAGALKPDGIFFMSVREGDGETFDTNEKYPGTRRFFGNYRDEEMRSLLAPRFSIIEARPQNIKNKYVFLNYFCSPR